MRASRELRLGGEGIQQADKLLLKAGIEQREEYIGASQQEHILVRDGGKRGHVGVDIPLVPLRVVGGDRLPGLHHAAYLLEVIDDNVVVVSGALGYHHIVDVLYLLQI